MRVNFDEDYNSFNPLIDIVSDGEVKELSNGNIVMSRATFNEYHNIAILNGIRAGDWLINYEKEGNEKMDS